MRMTPSSSGDVEARGRVLRGGLPIHVQYVETYEEGDVLDVPGRPRVMHRGPHLLAHSWAGSRFRRRRNPVHRRSGHMVFVIARFSRSERAGDSR